MIVMIFIWAIIDSHHHITMIVTVITIIAMTEPDFNARLRQLMPRRRPAFWHRPRRKQRCGSRGSTRAPKAVFNVGISVIPMVGI